LLVDCYVVRWDCLTSGIHVVVDCCSIYDLLLHFVVVVVVPFPLICSFVVVVVCVTLLFALPGCYPSGCYVC
jgi:hypothetical protein